MDKMVKQVLSGGLVPVGGKRYKERVKEGKYGENIMYSCMKMEKWDLSKNYSKE
jgi:hypothetical protein